ncbi:MAG: hypothetical protein LBQ77_05855 [Treponema sp.]|jgi:hypothetical protein|nr:hypothetical protein [Treponema sp.]
MVTTLLLIAVGITACVLLWFGCRLVFNKRPPAAEKPAIRTCPLCFSTLQHKERLYSIVFSEIGSARIIHIHGCPHCSTGALVRKCPVCKRILQTDDVVAARMTFKEKEKGVHVHILGCKACSTFFAS